MDTKPLIIKKKPKTITKNVINLDEKVIPTVNLKLGKRIAVARNEKGLTQKELAAKIYKPLSIIKDWEMGTGKFDKGILESIEKVLETKFSDEN